MKSEADRAAKRDALQPNIPQGAVSADTSKQVARNSYDEPVLFYVEKPFVCCDCDKQEVWTARQQKWYYEIAKGSLYATAIRCKACRAKRAKTHNGKGDPNPIKHEGSLRKHIQAAIGPAMAAAGFVLVVKSKRSDRGSFALDYSRGGLDITCRFDRSEATLVAESLDGKANYRLIASVSMNAPRTTAQILDRAQEFTDTVIEYVGELPS